MLSKISGTVDLKGKICLVTGASKGIGKGIAVALAYYGADCYITGRQFESLDKIRREVEENSGAGKCIPVQCDHSNDEEVVKLFEKIAKENDGRLDLLVNNAYSAVSFIFENLNKKFWEQPTEAWDTVNKVGLRNHYLCTVHASKMMVERRHGLIINVSSIGGLRYLFSVPYGVGKAANDRMAQDCAMELKKFGVAFISLWPGLVKTEFMIDNVSSGGNSGLTRTMLERAESVTFIGRTVAALLSENHSQMMQRTGRILLTTDIAQEHGITDENGEKPNSMRQLNVMLSRTGLSWLASYIPDFVKVPFCVLTMGAAYQK